MLEQLPKVRKPGAIIRGPYTTTDLSTMEKRTKPYERVAKVRLNEDGEAVSQYVEPRGIEALCSRLVWRAIKRLIAWYRMRIDDDGQLEELLTDAIYENDIVELL